MLDKQQATTILSALMNTGGDFAEIYAESRFGMALVWENGILDYVNHSSDGGCGLRLERGEETYYSDINGYEENDLLDAATALAEAPIDKSKAKKLIDFIDINTEIYCPVEKDPSTVDVNKKVQILSYLDKKAREYDQRIVQVTASYGDNNAKVLIANTEGVWANDDRTHVRLSMHIVASDGEGLETGYHHIAEQRGFEAIDEVDLDGFVTEACRLALVQLEAKPAPAGTFPVIISSSAGGTMVHEAVGHGMEADFAIHNESVYAGKLGQKVASGKISIVDDGTLSGKRGSNRVDDEGEPVQRVTLVKDGVLMHYLQSRKTARRLGSKATGNGRRQSYHHIPMPRMRNTFILPGKDDPKEIEQSLDKGLLVKKMGGGEVDITNGQFVFAVMEGYWIENGKIQYPVKGATLMGSGLDVISSIDMVGSDLGFDVGTCGKNGQGVPVSDAMPTIRIPSLTVGGMVIEAGQ